MGLRLLVSRNTISSLSRFNTRVLGSHSWNFSTFCSPSSFNECSRQNPESLNPSLEFNRRIHCTPSSMVSQVAVSPKIDYDDGEEDETMNEFLSRFVWIMRGRLSGAYPHCDKKTIDEMLLLIVEKVVAEMEKGGVEHMLSTANTGHSQEFSEDLWKVVWEVSNLVLDDMNKERKKEKMKGFLQCEEVQEMCRFAGETGIRGDMLRELRHKWAREKMEESEFYESLERLRKEAKAKEKEEEKGKSINATFEEPVMAEDNAKVVSLPKRHGKIKYKIYGLDLSEPRWAEVADKVNERGEIILPQEPKPITGKCKLVTEKILSLKDGDDVSPLLAEWADLLQPSRIDWINLLDKLKEQNTDLYAKIAEILLDEQSFQANIRDYSSLIEGHAKENRFDDAERILAKMNKNGTVPDIITTSVLVDMYRKAGNLDRAKEAFDKLTSHGFHLDASVYNSMILSFANSGQPKLGEALLRDMESRDIKPTEEIYMALLRSYVQCGDVRGAKTISEQMNYAGIEPSLEFFTLLIEAYERAGNAHQARINFDFMIANGHKPDDRCTASMIAAYEKNDNSLDKALNLLLELEKDGFEPGLRTYSVLVDWLGKLLLVEEVEQLLGKIAELGDAPPITVQVSLCDMYARAKIEKKTLQALGVLEAKSEQLGQDQFVQVIKGLIAGGFVQEARRVHRLMEARGFSLPEDVKMSLMISKA